MTLQKVRELLEVQVFTRQGYNRNAAHLILVEIWREHGHDATDQLIDESGRGVMRNEGQASFSNNITRGSTPTSATLCKSA